MSSPPVATSSTGPGASVLHKGKRTHRSWPQLPEELVRHIATYYLWQRATCMYVPGTWDAREVWHYRMVYTSLRDAFDLERTLMSVCPQWGIALETHLFWQQAVTLLDPTDYLAHLAVLPSLRPYRITPYRHFRNIINCSCLICRINLPATTRGLATAKRTVNSYFLGPVALCREHDQRRLAFCGLCLRESPIYEIAAPPLYAGADLQVAVLENEDEETWPGVDATCRNCRNEWLRKKASLNPRDQEAIGGTDLASDDWETRQSVEGFVELAEGTIIDVINLAREKYWLRKFTRLGDMMQQALAAAKFNNYPSRPSAIRGDADYTNWEESLPEEEEDEEEDTELMQLEEGGVKDLALGDWARTRILDGYWLSPADIWYRNTVPGKALDVPAVHPCPWTVEDRKEIPRPSPATVKAEMPPSFGLCEQAFIAHGQQLRLILLPAMKNIVRRIAIDCALADGSEDPTLKASRMSLEEVARILREEEGVWFEGYDWIERRRNDDEAQRERRGHDGSSSGPREDDARSPTSVSSSGESVGSDTTSPVLSTTTLQTTPSPPPLTEEKKDPLGLDDRSYDAAIVAEKVVIPVEPVMNPPRILRSIPHIPITLAHLPQYSIDAFKNVWREACAPLYHCRCRICERAVAAANAGNSPAQQYRQPQSGVPPLLAPALAAVGLAGVQQQQQKQKQQRRESPVQIQLQEVSEIEFVEDDGEEEEEGYDEADCDDEREEEEEEEDEDETERERVTVRIPPSARTRKRSSDEIEDEEERTRLGSPPKRLRKEHHDGSGRKSGVVHHLERVQRKRSSEELDEGDEHPAGVGKKKKRARLGEVVSGKGVVGSLSPAKWGRRRRRSESEVEVGGEGTVSGGRSTSEASPRSTSRSRSRSMSPPRSRSMDDDDASEGVDADADEGLDADVGEDYAAWYNAVKAREIRIGSASESGEEDEDTSASVVRLDDVGRDGPT